MEIPPKLHGVDICHNPVMDFESIWAAIDADDHIYNTLGSECTVGDMVVLIAFDDPSDQLDNMQNRNRMNGNSIRRQAYTQAKHVDLFHQGVEFTRSIDGATFKVVTAPKTEEGELVLTIQTVIK